MTVQLHFEKHKTVKGVEGAYFSGREYGYSRLRHKFFSYAQIEQLLAGNQSAASTPNCVWTTFKKDKSGERVEDGCKLTTLEFTKALENREEVGLNRMFAAADRAQRDSMMFMFGFRDTNSGLYVARFGNGRETQDLIKPHIKDRINGSPYEGAFIPDRELIRAMNRLQELGKTPLMIGHDKH